VILFDRTLYSTEHSRVENSQEQTLTNHDTLSTADRRRQTECCWDVSMPTWVKGGRKSRTPRTQRERMVSLMRQKMRRKMWCFLKTTDEALGKASFNSAKRPTKHLAQRHLLSTNLSPQALNITDILILAINMVKK